MDRPPDHVPLRRAAANDGWLGLPMTVEQNVGVAQAMYGKNGDFDGFLRKLRKTPVTVETVRAEVEQFLVIMANLSAV